jgi:GNAT superfamily N-acetyltransferase
VLRSIPCQGKPLESVATGTPGPGLDESLSTGVGRAFRGNGLAWRRDYRRGSCEIRENPYIQPMSQSAAVPYLSKVPICILALEHRVAIEQHLIDLPAEDRYLRFGYAATDEHIRRYVEQIRFDRDEVFGIFNRHLQLIAMAHLAYAIEPDRTNSAEFGVSVSPHARGRGYGSELFDRAVIHARNHGVNLLHVHALSENAAMLTIARNGGATVVRDGGDSLAHLVLPPANFESQLLELVDEQLARTNYRFKAQRQWLLNTVRRLTGRLGAAPSPAKPG